MYIIQNLNYALQDYFLIATETTKQKLDCCMSYILNIATQYNNSVIALINCNLSKFEGQI